ncbi:protein obstructor-E-like [Artemia franciscana]|uniref:protein obstructor-E-like n=1 Tax=Artemia franciscana TaxID=6661 RepID=UPI0032DB9D96
MDKHVKSLWRGGFDLSLDSQIFALAQEYGEISSCPQDYGLQLYPHPRYCDQFYKCENGTLTLESCENGLLFDGKGSVHNFCNYHWAVDCKDRTYELEKADRSESAYCPYLFGIFPISSGCETGYYRCAYGEAEIAECEKGLAYDERIHACNWPDLLIDENGCDPERVVGFTCPDPDSLPKGSLVQTFLPYPRYAVPGDCKRLITCVNGYPRLLTCGEYEAFNEYSLSCDSIDNVPNCK